MKDLEEALALIRSCHGDLIVTGIGKSGAIAEKLSATLTSLGRRAAYLHPVDAIHGDVGALSKGDVLIALSFSGESREVLRLASYAKKEFGVPLISITKSKSSSLGKMSEIVVGVPVEEEGSPSNLAPMASTTAMLVLGDMLASMLAPDVSRKDFAKLHPGGSLGLELAMVGERMKTSTKLPKVSEAASAEEALEEMSRKSLGVSAVIDKGGKLKGVITDGDVRRWLLDGGDILRDKARDMMTKSPKTIPSSTSLKDALSAMERYHITTLFTTDKRGKLEGIIHIHDILDGNIS